MSKAKIKLPYISVRSFTKWVLWSLGATLLQLAQNIPSRRNHIREQNFTCTEYLLLIVAQTSFAFYFCFCIILANLLWRNKSVLISISGFKSITMNRRVVLYVFWPRILLQSLLINNLTQILFLIFVHSNSLHVSSNKCSSSGESFVSIRTLVYVTLCRWPCGMQV